MAKQSLGLGSVQFGMEYGVGKELKSLSREEVEGILGEASELGIDLIDTASLYGDAEEKLSNSQYKNKFQYVSKTIKSDQEEITDAFLGEFKSSVEKSIERLGPLDGVLFHKPSDVFKKSGEKLYQYLFDLKSSGSVKKIGFSIYDPKLLEDLKKSFDFDLVQLPINIFDQRAEENSIVRELSTKGVEFHSRSTFLKGLIFQDEEDLTGEIVKEVETLRSFHLQCREREVSPIEMAFSYVKKQEYISRVIIGVQSVEQLRQTYNQYKAAKVDDVDYGAFRMKDSRMLNPSNW